MTAQAPTSSSPRRARASRLGGWLALALASVITGASPLPLSAQPRPAAVAAKRSAAPVKENPADRENRQLAGEAMRLGKSPAGVVPLLELLERWDESTPSTTIALLEEVAKSKKLSPERAVLAQVVLSQARSRLGDAAALEAPFAELGYATHFRVIGPFDNEGKSGFDTELEPEKKRMEPVDLEAAYPGRERPVRYRELPEHAIQRGYVPLGAVLRPRQNVCALAETIVHSDKAQPLTLWAGAGGAIKVYWNGEPVLRDEAYRLPSPDRGVAVVGAHAGANRVMVKVCVTSSAFGFFLRVGDAKGGVAKGVRIALAPDAETGIAPGHAKLPLPKAPETALAALERAAQGDGAKAMYELARYLRATGSDDPAERRAKQLAARAAELEPTLDHLALAVELAEERAERMRFAGIAEQKLPNDAGSLLLRARVTAGGPVPEDALPLIERIGESERQWPAAQLLRAAILRDLELTELASRVTERVHARVGDTPAVLRRLADVYQASSAPDRAIAMRRELLALRADDVGSRRVLIADALNRGATAEVLEQLEAYQRLSFDNSQTTLYVAGLYDALGRDDMVLATYRAAMQLVPEAAEIHAAYGRALLRAERPELAAEALAQALILKPQDAATRELLEQIRPSTREDEAYAVPAEQLLAMRDGDAGYPSTVLSTLRVNTVFENGLGSSFFQHAAQVHNEEGARQYRSFPIQYDPDAQRVDVRLARVYRKDGSVLEAVRSFEQQLGEPWYRIYYDTRALIIVFPDLKPGDVVELRYRIDDVAHRNLFADYYGDLHPMQGGTPTRRSEYVLITPKSRKFFVHEPSLQGLEHSEAIDGERRIQRWLAKDVPAIVPELGMPGITETSPYLHVSTYETWQAVGRWYWGLIKDQLYADAALKRTVRELVAGATTTREKVERIHNWVVKNTRYVGLEFGIHGFLPYRVPLIVQRGFGDCKDKASLLYTMMREAGVEARIVLVRTRRNGDIVERPASLAVFDHAIAYVPELDLYLDGTAEHSGTRELPVQDQGVMVLVVGPESAELRQTPVLDAEASTRTRTLNVQLAADGSARVEGEETITGAEAAGYRAHYEAPGTRKERFERALGDLYPGLTLEEQRFESLAELEKPVRYHYALRAPQLATWDGDELRLPPSNVRDLLPNMARLQTRRYALDLHGRHRYVEERVIELPPGWQPATLPAGGEASSPFGVLRIAIAQKGGAITARTELSLLRDKITPAEYPAFRSWVEQADQLVRQRIGIQKLQAAGDKR